MASIQSTIPHRAADAVDFPALRRDGAGAKLPRTTIEYSSHSTPVGQTRITCSVEMAVLLGDQLRAIAVDAGEHGKSELVLACAAGVASIYAAVDKERGRPPEESPASHIKPAPN